MTKFFSVLAAFIFIPGMAQAEFLLSSAIVEFSKDSPRQQDIEIVSRSQDSDYIVAEISEVINPGTPNETRRAVTDPSQSRLLVTPDKTVLAGGERKVMRFVMLGNPDDSEHIYRVAVKPVIRGLDNTSKVGLKVLIGYEVLVIIRPNEMKPSYTAQRQGKYFEATNNGNTNVLFQNGQQCLTEKDCKLPPVLRLYPGQQNKIELPMDRRVSYSVWDGVTLQQKDFD